jgi:tetratricopeptide (TPR) repeat protein
MFGGRRKQREIDELQDLVNAHDAAARRMMPLGRWVEAYQHNSMALAAVFQLEQLDPGSSQHEPVLAAKLYNQATIARHVGDMKVALSAAKEAVEIYERLARRDPATYQTLLADARARLGLLTGVTGDRGTARALGGQAAQAYRDAATSDPEKEHDLARVLAVQANAAWSTNRDEAVEAAWEALRIFRRLPAPLAPSDQEAFGVAALMVAKASHDSGRDRDLHDAATDAVEHFRACFERAPDDNAGWYAQSLALLACHHERQGDLAQARHAATEATAVLQRSPTASPGRPEAEHLITALQPRLRP